MQIQNVSCQQHFGLGKNLQKAGSFIKNQWPHLVKKAGLLSTAEIISPSQSVGNFIWKAICSDIIEIGYDGIFKVWKGNKLPANVKNWTTLTSKTHCTNLFAYLVDFMKYIEAKLH